MRKGRGGGVEPWTNLTIAVPLSGSEPADDTVELPAAHFKQLHAAGVARIVVRSATGKECVLQAVRQEFGGTYATVSKALAARLGREVRYRRARQRDWVRLNMLRLIGAFASFLGVIITAVAAFILETSPDPTQGIGYVAAFVVGTLVCLTAGVVFVRSLRW